MSETLKFDPKTYDWMQDREWSEITVTKCKVCGLHYKPELGHFCNKAPKLEFNRVLGKIELRACPVALENPCKGKPNNTIDVVMWCKDSDGKPYCISLAYFVRDNNGYYLKFVGARPFIFLAAERVPELWEALQDAQKVLDGWFYDTEAMKDET